MILNEYQVDGINNGTVFLKQRNHDAVMKLKSSYDHYSWCWTSKHATIFDSGRIVDVGPAVELHFDFDGYDSSCVLYGDTEKIKAWVAKTIKLLKHDSIRL